MRNNSQSLASSIKPAISELEKTLLLTTFDTKLEFEKRDAEQKQEEISPSIHAIPELVSLVGETLMSAVRSHVEFAEAQVN